jgi:hypothetical protein
MSQVPPLSTASASKKEPDESSTVCGSDDSVARGDSACAPLCRLPSAFYVSVFDWCAKWVVGRRSASLSA